MDVIRSHIESLVQERRNSSPPAMELRLSCTNPSICCIMIYIISNIDTINVSKFYTRNHHTFCCTIRTSYAIIHSSIVVLYWFKRNFSPTSSYWGIVIDQWAIPLFRYCYVYQYKNMCVIEINVLIWYVSLRRRRKICMARNNSLRNWYCGHVTDRLVNHTQTFTH